MLVKLLGNGKLIKKFNVILYVVLKSVIDVVE